MLFLEGVLREAIVFFLPFIAQVGGMCGWYFKRMEILVEMTEMGLKMYVIF